MGLRMSAFLSFLVTALLAVVFKIPGSNSQIVRGGNCPNPNVTPLTPPLTLTTLVDGSPWFVTHRTKSFFGLKPYCERFQFTEKQGAMNTLEVVITGNIPLFNRVTINGEMTTTPPNFQRYTVTFKRTVLSTLVLPNLLSSQYIILGTSGGNQPTLAVIYSCNQSGSFFVESAYVLSRTRFINTADLDTARSILTGAGLSNTLREAEQTVCSS
ncbi:uncharacterized protein LOC124153672 [Ischnura elegans]|uniref:uncharacterized protein LOC124153672 n=1 Tax=Ischnura elegans TaxID=197161 RepID=UPI001ED89C2F|nr:uncharacterized protein LOC124153672 [Ischnura elegans]